MTEVRVVRPDEYAEAGEVVVAAYRHLPGDHIDDDYAVVLADVARRAEHAAVLVAVDAGRVVGVVTYVPDHRSPYAELLVPGEAGVRMLAVHPDAQGRGIGEALSRACVDRARAEGKRRLCLHSTPWMTAAHRIYERLGFRREPERDWTPAPGVPLLGFALDLRPSGVTGNAGAREAGAPG